MSAVINAIRRVNDRLSGLVNALGADNPIVQDYIARMESSVPDQYLRYNEAGLPQIIRSKDFEKKGYTVRDFDNDRFKGITGLRKEYGSQYAAAKKEIEEAGGKAPTKNAFIASMGDLKGNIPLLYKNQSKAGVRQAIDTLQKSHNTYDELLGVVDVIGGLMNESDTEQGDSAGSHTITFD